MTLDAWLMISAIKIRAEMISYAMSRYTYESCRVCRLWEKSTGPQTKRRKCTTSSFSVQANHENHTSFWMSMPKGHIYFLFWWFSPVLSLPPSSLHPSLPPSLPCASLSLWRPRWSLEERLVLWIGQFIQSVQEGKKNLIWFSPENPFGIPLRFFPPHILCAVQ